MSDNIDTRVTLSLHPDNVKKVEGYDDDTAHLLAPTLTAFSAAYEGLKQIHNARAAAGKNPTWNEASVLIQTQDFADKVLDKITRNFDGVRTNLVKGISAMEAELSRPVESKAAHTIATEIRAHLKSLPKGSERTEVIRQAIVEGDHIVVAAALGAPAMLSGIDPAMQKVLTRVYHEHHNPQTAKRLKAMQGARDMIESKAGLVFTEMEKAVGASPHKVNALRKYKNASEQAFILKDAT